MIRRMVACTLTLCLVMTMSVSAQKRTAESLLPIDTQAVMIMRNLPALSKKFNESAWRKIFDDKKFQQYFAPMIKEFNREAGEDFTEMQKEMERVFGMPMGELFGMMQGDVSIGISGITPDMIEKIDRGNEMPFSMIMTIDVGQHADKFKQAMLHAVKVGNEEAAANGGKVPRQEIKDYLGAEVHLYSAPEGDNDDVTVAWTVTGKHFVAAINADGIYPVVKRLSQNNAEGALSSHRGFQQFAQQSAKHDILMYANLKDIMSTIMDALDREAQGDPNEDFNPMSPTMIMKAMGLDQLDDLTMSVGLDQDSTITDLSINYREKIGLMKVLSIGPEEARQPKFIPDDVVSAAVLVFHIDEAWKGIMEIAAGINPIFPVMVQQQLAQMKQQMGVDIEKDIVNNIGPELIVIEGKPVANEQPGGPNNPLQALAGSDSALILIEMKDRQRFMNAMNTMMAQGGVDQLMQKREYLGADIYTFNNGAVEMSIAYMDRHFVVSVNSTKTLEALIIKMRRGGKSIWEREDVARALKTLPPRACALSVQDLPVMLKQLSDMFSLMQEFDADAEVVNPQHKPTIEDFRKYFGVVVGANYHTNGKLRAVSRIVHPAK